jgi:hypothetical protein
VIVSLSNDSHVAIDSPGAAQKLRYRSSAAVVVGAAAILLLPAYVFGRPFIFWDTPTFYAWGHDIVAALKDPWPPLANFPTDRGLWIADMFPETPERITPDHFQLVFTQIGARSEFYALPLYVLGSRFGLWAPAALQATLTAWVLWAVFLTIAPGRRLHEFLVVVAILAFGTTAGTFATFLMPDVFAALGVLAAGLLLFHFDKLSRWRRFGCAVVVGVSALVHTSHGVILSAEVLIAMTTARLFTAKVPTTRGAAILALTLFVAFVALVGSRSVLKAIFGQEVRNPPFLEGRVIADGPGQRYLDDVCATHPYAACLFQRTRITKPDDIIWVNSTTPPVVSDLGERHRFLNEQFAVVLGTLARFPVQELRDAVWNGLAQLATFDIEDNTGGSIPGLLREGSYRAETVRETVPNIAVCVATANACNYDARFHGLWRVVRYAVVLVAAFAVAFYLGGWLPLPRG